MDRPNREILEAIECCRPGGEDVRTPDMARLAEEIEADPALRAKYEAVQRSDSHIGRAFRDLPVPDGLQDRVLASLAWDEAGTGHLSDREVAESETDVTGDREAESPTPTEDAAVQPAAHIGRKRVTRRRWWYAAAVGTAVVVLIAVTITAITQMAADPEMSWEDFRQLVKASVSTAIDENGWDGNFAAAPEDRPFPSDDFQINPIGWRQVRLGSLDDRATVYLLSDHGQSEVVLLVTRSRRVALVTEVCPSNSFPTSGNQSIGAWRWGDYLCVLVVRGPGHRQRYRSTIPQLQVG